MAINQPEKVGSVVVYPGMVAAQDLMGSSFDFFYVFADQRSFSGNNFSYYGLAHHKMNMSSASLLLSLSCVKEESSHHAPIF